MQVKCQVCGNKEEKSEMYCDAGKTKKYYHHSCWPLELQERERKAKEKTQWDALVKFIETIHNLYRLPQPFYPFLQDMRNGTVRFRGPVVDKFKEGIGYDVILEAYRLSTDDIKRARNNVPFENNIFRELKYGLRIVEGNINRAIDKIRKNKETEQILLSVVKKQETKNVIYKPKKSDRDISAFLEE